MEVRKKEIEELQSQAQALSQEGKSTDEVDSKRLTVQTKFMELLEPLSERKHNLLASKEIHQFNRDVEDEIVSRPSPHTWRFHKPPGLSFLEARVFPSLPDSLGCQAELSKLMIDVFSGFFPLSREMQLHFSVWFSKDILVF